LDSRIRGDEYAPTAALNLQTPFRYRAVNGSHPKSMRLGEFFTAEEAT